MPGYKNWKAPWAPYAKLGIPAETPNGEEWKAKETLPQISPGINVLWCWEHQVHHTWRRCHLLKYALCCPIGMSEYSMSLCEAELFGPHGSYCASAYWTYHSSLCLENNTVHWERGLKPCSDISPHTRKGCLPELTCRVHASRSDSTTSRPDRYDLFSLVCSLEHIMSDRCDLFSLECSLDCHL